MAIENVELMHDFRPKHLLVGAAKKRNIYFRLVLFAGHGPARDSATSTIPPGNVTTAIKMESWA